jgi:RNA recognition motif-containing protein
MRIFIANIKYSRGHDDLRRLFANYGEVAGARVIFDGKTGKSRGFGFADMPNPDEAKKAIAGLHDSPWDGRRLIVNEARDTPAEHGRKQ